jgi:transglutaminase-like putative cysteine protease
MKIFILIFLLSLAVLSLSCTTALLMDASALREELGLEKMPTPEDYPEVDGVVLLDRQAVEMDLERNTDLFTYNKVHKIQKLFRNLDAHATIEIPLYDGESLTELRARTIKPNGRNIYLKDQDFFTITGEVKGSVLYADTKLVRFTFPAVEKGCIIDYQYTKKTQRAFWYDIWKIQNYLPTLKSEYILTVPVILMDKERGLGWTWRYKSYNYAALPPPVQTPMSIFERMANSDKVSFAWTLHDIPAFLEEPNMPPPSLNMAYVRFSLADWSNWDAISSWYFKRLFEPQLAVTDMIHNLALDLTAGAETDAEKILRITNYVHGIRYVAIDLGSSSLQPALPQVVVDRKYGDCKDKAALLVSMLKDLHIEAEPVLMLTASEGLLDPEFPTWSFNHMIVKTATHDRQVFWIDPTVNYCQQGRLPWQDEGIDVLVLHGDGTSSIERTPNASCDQNVTDIDVNVYVGTETETKFSVAITYSGEKNFRSRAFFSDYSDRELKDFCKELIVDNFLDAVVQHCSLTNFDTLSCDLKLAFEFSVPKALKKQGDLFLLNIDPFKLFTDLSWLARDTRIYPIDLEYPYTIKKRIKVFYPQEKYVVRNLPEKIEFKNDNIVYLNGFTSSAPHQLLEEESFAVQQPYIPAHRYAELRKLFEVVKSRSVEQLIFTQR